MAIRSDDEWIVIGFRNEHHLFQGKCAGSLQNPLWTPPYIYLALYILSYNCPDDKGSTSKCILKSVDNLSTAQRFVLTDLLDQITYLMGKETMVEDVLFLTVLDNSRKEL